MKKIIISVVVVVVIIIILAGGYFVMVGNQTTKAPGNQNTATTSPEASGTAAVNSPDMPKIVEHEPPPSGSWTGAEPKEDTLPAEMVIGNSVNGNPITAYNFGNGDMRLLLVGGMHGGYEWNSVLLARKFVDYFKENESTIPANMSVTVIPLLNPDGLEKVIGSMGDFSESDITKSVSETIPGRYNAHDVDLNRNFACHWKPKSYWNTEKVDAGTAAFSEPETRALRDFINKNTPVAGLFFHSQGGMVFGSQCGDGMLPGTKTLMNLYAKNVGYRAVPDFTAYKITGDAEGWLSTKNIPAVTVELTTHDSIEWQGNLAAVKAVLGHYSNNAPEKNTEPTIVVDDTETKEATDTAEKPASETTSLTDARNWASAALSGGDPISCEFQIDGKSGTGYYSKDQFHMILTQSADGEMNAMQTDGTIYMWEGEKAGKSSESDVITEVTKSVALLSDSGPYAGKFDSVKCTKVDSIDASHFAVPAGVEFSSLVKGSIGS